MVTEPGPRAVLGRARHRIALAVLLVGAGVLSPTVAWAAFSGGTSAAVTAGSLTLAAPAPVSLSVTCPKPGTGTVKVTFPNVSRATDYTVELDPPRGSVVTMTTTTGTTGVTFTINRNGSYSVSVTAGVQNWDSAATVQTFSC